MATVLVPQSFLGERGHDVSHGLEGRYACMPDLGDQVSEGLEYIVRHFGNLNKFPVVASDCRLLLEAECCFSDHVCREGFDSTAL